MMLLAIIIKTGINLNTIRKAFQSTLANAWEKVLFGVLQWQTEGTVFGFVESKLPGFGGEGGRGLLEG